MSGYQESRNFNETPMLAAFVGSVGRRLFVLCLLMGGCVEPLPEATIIESDRRLDDSGGPSDVHDGTVHGETDRGNESDAMAPQCPGENDPCDTGLFGACGPGRKVCEGTIAVCRPEHVRTAEMCNGIDDDCDSKTDEEFPEEMDDCVVPEDEICGFAQGESVCEDGEVICQPRPGNEVCNGLDDDCDGRVDEERICGQYVSDHCRLWIGRSNADGLGQDLSSENWYGVCPREQQRLYGGITCNSTTHDDQFKLINLNVGPFGRGNTLGVAFTCDPNAPRGVGAIIEQSCRFFLAHRDAYGSDGGGGQRVESWGPCPSERPDPLSEEDLRCTSTGGDGRFHALLLEADLSGGQGLGVAWKCEIPGDENWSAILTEDVEVYLGISKSERAVFDPPSGQPSDGSPNQGFASTWNQCPTTERDNNGDARCVSTGGDGWFHQIGLPPGRLTSGSMMSIRMTPTERAEE